MNDIKRFFSNRRIVLLSCAILFSSLLVGRVFALQIINGADYQDNYRLKVERQEVIEGTRGNIYDRNGNILAYNKLANAVTIEDIGTYETDKEKNDTINTQLYEVIKILLENGDKLYSDFGIYMDSNENYFFKDEGTRLRRFRADIFGRNDPANLKYNERLGLDESSASADEIMTYLCDRRYGISQDYEKYMRYNIATVRYRMGLNTYQKYISTTIASDISQKSVAYIMENKYRYTGINIEEQSVRVYENAECFANIIGYTGTISTEEYEELSQTDDSYTLNDTIGKSGIEQYMNSDLMGTKGYQTVYVDSLGNLLETAEKTEQKSGNDVYLSIDKDLSIKTYNLLEQEIAGILYSKIVNSKEYDTEHVLSRDNILIPVYDVYYALINNRVININKSVDLTSNEERVFNQFSQKFEEILSHFETQLTSSNSVIYEQLSDEYQNYSTYLVKKLKSEEIFDSKLIDNQHENQKLWTSEKMSVNDYLRFCIEMGWINIERFVGENEYVDVTEIYERLIEYSIEMLRNDDAFRRNVYYYALIQDRIDIDFLLRILYDQNVLDSEDGTKDALFAGTITPYDFIMSKIKDISISPGQLGLDPCSGSCVVTDPNTGEILALVSYPGFDSNRLANNLDNDYYAYLNANESRPLYNHATQERTAPGSTFKIISAIAGLGEGVVDVSSIIEDEGKFLKVDNEPGCWIYPNSTHGEINITEAIRDSCNYFFYEVGWLLAGGELYNDKQGIDRISKYAKDFGLDEKTGIEIEESSPKMATEYPVMAAIGQSDHNYTTIDLSRYVTAVANNGKVYDFTLLSKVVDKDGNTLETFGPQLKNELNNISFSTWNVVHTGMRMVVENLNAFQDFPINVAGKTGTAQQSKSRPNHALFVGYAPYESPQISIACRISFGYTSGNAADFAKRLLADYFDVDEYEASQQAIVINSNNSITD